MKKIIELFKSKTEKTEKKPESNLYTTLEKIVIKHMKLIDKVAMLEGYINNGALIYISHTQTNRIMYANNVMKELFGKDLEGKLCHEVFHDNKQPCDFCNNKKLLKKLDTPYKWIWKNKKLDRLFLITDIAFKFNGNGDILRFEHAIEIDKELINQLKPYYHG